MFALIVTRVPALTIALLANVLLLPEGAAAPVSLPWAKLAETFGALATVTRPNGIVIALPLLMMAVSQPPAGRVLTGRLFALAPIPLALVAHSAYLSGLTGTPLAWLDAQRHWDYSLGNMPHRHLLNTLLSVERHGLYASLIASETAAIDFLYTTVALLFLALVPAVIRRFGVPMGTYVLMGIAIPLSGRR